MINDGSANRLISTTLSGVTSLYGYNGDGTRLRQTVAGTVTTYTQDLVAPLPVVLQSRTGVTTTKYLYATGTRPLAQSITGWEYLLPDALGSVRQIANTSGYIIRTQDYEPYGSALNSSGSGQSIYGFTGEQIDTYIKLLFLRARYYSPETARFLSKDVWQGDYTRPQSLNAWMYVEGDPINSVDPSGYIAQGEENSADNIRADLQNNYAVTIPKDYGTGPNYTGAGQCGTRWYDGAWKTLTELEWTQQAIATTATAMGGTNKFKSAMRRAVVISRWVQTLSGTGNAMKEPFTVVGDIVLPNTTFDHGEEYAKYTVIHELGHLWDFRTSYRLSHDMMTTLGTQVCEDVFVIGRWQRQCKFSINAQPEPPAGNRNDPYAARNAEEDWAESFMDRVYPVYYSDPGTERHIGPLRRQYVQDQIRSIP